MKSVDATPGSSAKLDEMAGNFRTTKARFADGQWKLLGLYTAFDLGTRAPENVFQKYISLAEEWQRSRPESVTVRCVLANLWTGYAWKARGSSYASDVKEEAWPLVNERLAKAWDILNEPLKPGMLDCPRRHSFQLTLAKVMGMNHNEFEILFREAIRQEPGYYQHYIAKADYSTFAVADTHITA